MADLDLPPLLGVADLAARWGYTRQGVNQLVRLPGFPAPAVTLNQGHTRVWALTNVEAFERGRPEFGDGLAERRKRLDCLHALQQGQTPPSDAG